MIASKTPIGRAGTHHYGVWGSGHTQGTDPTRKGWRFRQAWSGGPLLIGRKNTPGCATLLHTGDGRTWSVAVYAETPEQVAAARANLDPVRLEEVDDYAGFGLHVIRLIRSAVPDNC